MEKILLKDTIMQNDKKYNVVIDNFQGPLDLLCFLITKNKMDVFDISLSEITDKYVEYLNDMKELNMEIATEFLVMASTLLYLKSKRLLPIVEPEEEIVEEITEEQLMNRIIQYKLYKEKQQEFRQMYENNFGTFEKLPEKIKLKLNIDYTKLFNLSILKEKYFGVLKRKEDNINIQAKNIERMAVYDKTTVKSKIKQIVDIFKTKSVFVFNKIFNKNDNKNLDIVTAFLGILELSRLKNVTIEQKEMFGDITVKKINNKKIDLSIVKE